MKTRTFGPRNFLNFTVAACALACVTLSFAQAQSTAADARASAAKAVASISGHAVVSSGEKRTDEESPSKGLNTGIRVHGHWVIEVKNPNGTVARRREFENSLATGSNCCGDKILAGLVGGVLTSPSWAVLLSANGTVVDVIDISQANSGAATWCTNFAQQQPVFSCSTNLSVTVPESGNPTVISGGTVTFSGSGIVPQNFPATIGYVATSGYPTSTLLGQPGGVFTSRTLDGQNGDPPAVPVVPGQTVAVTVTVSFQ